jgi:rare lipoprotein A (peptidoglycan hydrolase)
MNDLPPRHRAASHNRRSRPHTFTVRPDRVALWAVFMALIAMLAAAASSAQGASGGVGTQEEVEGTEASCDNTEFWGRTLARGDCGQDVKTLNWVIRATPFGRKVPFGKRFKGRTDRAVQRFKRRKDLGEDGVVNRRTGRKLIASMRRDLATWYGPGFYGNRTACGQRLTRRTVGVAHKKLPCGTRVAVRYKGRFIRTRVIDRGPYAHGAKWDLTNRAAKKLRFTHTDEIRVAVAR